MNKEEMKQAIINAIQLLLNSKEEEKENFAINFFGILATTLLSENSKKKDLINQLGEILMSVYSNPDLDINNIISRLTQVNIFVSKEIQKLESQEKEEDKAEVTEKELESKKRFLPHESNIDSIPQNTTRESLKTEFVSNEATKQRDSILLEKKMIQYREHDWKAYVYGEKGLFSNFGSTKTNWKPEFHLTKVKHIVYSKNNKNYTLEFGLKQLNRLINDKGARHGISDYYLSLSLSDEELEHFCGNEDTVFKLSTGEDLMDAIEHINEQQHGIGTNMPKILLPFSPQTITVNEQDLFFAKILIDYYCYNMELTLFIPNWMICSKGFTNFNILSNNQPINVNEMLSLTRLFKHFNKDFTIDANIPQYGFSIKPIRNITNQKNANHDFFIFNSGIIKQPEKESVFTLNIAYEFSSEQNIISFYYYLLNSTSIQHVLEANKNYQERIISWHNTYQEKYGKQYLEFLEKDSLYKSDIKYYKKSQNFLNYYDSIRNKTLKLLEQLYKYKFGTSIKKNGSSTSKK